MVTGVYNFGIGFKCGRMDDKKLYICVSLGSPEFYLTFYGEETTDIKLAAKCTSRSCAKIIVEGYKKNHKKATDLFFVVEEYIED
nr:MAG TPA: hypothetical protein [Caudoviricetes sp.]